MQACKIFETNTFRKELSQRTSGYEERLVLGKLEKQIYPQLKAEPHYGNHIKKLKGYEPETWRYRIGDFRIFYSIDEENKVVIIASFRFRKDAYR